VLSKLDPILHVLSRVATKWVFCDFAKYESGRNDILISRNFAKYFLYFAKFRRVLSFAKGISRNFVKYLFREMISPKFREISRNTF